MLNDEVTSWRESFTEDTSDDDLVLMMHKQVAHGPAHIAAKQELAARREAREQTRHRELEARLEDLKIPHWSALWTFWIASAAVIIALGAWLFPRSPNSPPGGQPVFSEPTHAAPPLPIARTPSLAPIVVPPPRPSASSALPEPTQPPSPTTAIQQPKAVPTPPKE